jgi:hypothetical protein
MLLGGSYAYARREVRGRLNWFNIRKSHNEPAITLEQASAATAGIDMFANLCMFPRRNRAIEISGQAALGVFTIHRCHPFMVRDPQGAEAAGTPAECCEPICCDSGFSGEFEPPDSTVLDASF